MQQLPILLIPEKTDAEFEQIFASWIKRGGIIKRLGKYWIKDDNLSKQLIAIYGNQTFALVLAQIYDVQLISPDDTLIGRLENEWIKRSVLIRKINDIKESDFPVFIKPVIPKLFLAGVFKDIAEFSKAIEGLPESEEILISNIVDIDAEARSFIMDGGILDIALYEGSAEIETGRDFLLNFLNAKKLLLPDVLVIDLAYSKQVGWFILEFNACWGAGLNNCSAEKVIDSIIKATHNYFVKDW